MRYTTGEYLMDSFWFLEPLINSATFIRSILVRTIRNFIEFDFAYALGGIVENLPTGVAIIFLGFLSCFFLLKSTEAGFGNRISSIVTSSMEPAIPSGSLIFSRPGDSYKLGDIVTYVEKTPEGISTGKLLTHRIVAVNSRGGIITKGDANRDPDPNEISTSQIAGRVDKVIPYVGYLEFLLGTLPGFLVLVAAPAYWIVRGQIKDLSLRRFRG